MTAIATWGGDALPDGVTIGPADLTRYTAVQLSERLARRLTEEIRGHLGQGIRKLVRAREGGAHLAMGYATWHEYCEAEFGDLRDLALPSSERLHLVASMKASRLPNRPIAERLGCSPGTVAGDVARLRASGWEGPDTVTSSDGSERPARIASARVTEEPDYRGLSRVSESLARVAAQQDRGLTSLELDAETGWPMGTATASLSKVERRGWAVRIEEPAHRRRARAPYVVTDAGLTALDALLVPHDDAERAP